MRKKKKRVNKERESHCARKSRGIQKWHRRVRENVGLHNFKVFLNKRNILRLIEKKERNKVEKHQDDTDRATCIKLANGSKKNDDITEMRFWSTEVWDRSALSCPMEV